MHRGDWKRYGKWYFIVATLQIIFIALGLHPPGLLYNFFCILGNTFAIIGLEELIYSVRRRFQAERSGGMWVQIDAILERDNIAELTESLNKLLEQVESDDG